MCNIGCSSVVFLPSVAIWVRFCVGGVAYYIELDC